MPYSLIGDTWHRDARWMSLAAAAPGGGSGPAVRRRRQLLKAALVDMMCESAAGGRGDGYVTKAQALDVCADDPWMLDELTKSFRGRPPFLHQPGQKCAERNCIDDSDPWDQDYEFRICSYNKNTPFTRVRKLRAAQARERKDPELKRLAYERDGGCCRYCRSGPLNRKITVSNDRRKVPQFDHVDHKELAGPDKTNYVTGCASCNEYKGARTPEQADMVLLPEPRPAQRAAWAEQGLMLFDRPSSTDVITDRPTNGPPPRPRTDHENDRGRNHDQFDGHSHAPNRDVLRPETPVDQQDHDPNAPMKGVRTGPDRYPTGGGPPVPVEPFSPNRSRADPSPTPRTRW